MKKQYLQLTYLLLIPAIAVYILNVYRIWAFTIDDTFITLRYAQNLAHGFGPNYNPGGAHTEGLTSFLWMVLLVPPYLLNLDGLMLAKSLGIVFTGCTGLLLVLMGSALLKNREIIEGRLIGLFAAINFLILPSSAVHAVSGMETGFFTFLLVLFCLVFVLLVQKSNFKAKDAFGFAVLAFLLCLARPESILVVSVLFVASEIRFSPSGRKPFLISILVGFVLPGIVYFILRWWYYGYLFPLPFYVKTLLPEMFHENHEPGYVTVQKFLSQLLPYHLFLCISLLFRPRRFVFPILCSYVLWMIFYSFPYHVMGYEWRFLYPLLPLLFLLSGIGFYLSLKWIGNRIQKDSNRARIMIWSLFILTGSWSALRFHEKRDASLNIRKIYTEGLTNAHIQLGKKLHALNSDDRILKLAIADAGAVPYYSGWYAIDTFGLNNPELAASGQHSIQSILDQHPDVVVLISESDQQLQAPLKWEEDLYQACLKQGMVDVIHLKFKKDYYLWVMSDPDSPVGKKLLE